MQEVTLRSWMLGRWPATIVLVLGVAWAYANLEELHRALMPRHWPTVLGVVTEARISDDIETVVAHYGTTYTRSVTRLHVRYKYTVDGRNYSSTQLNLWPPTAHSNPHHQLARYSSNAPVTVYYD